MQLMVSKDKGIVFEKNILRKGWFWLARKLNLEKFNVILSKSDPYFPFNSVAYFPYFQGQAKTAPVTCWLLSKFKQAEPFNLCLTLRI